MTPLLKKPGLDIECLKNYRPISNLPFLTKLLEKVVLRQLQTHLVDNGLLDVYQSAYRKNHSTETALLHVVNKLLLSSDQNKVSVLSLLDLSAAFDTIDHQILLNRLKHDFGITDSALKWFTSYLTDRSQRVIVGNTESKPLPLLLGVPQGSVLGPVLFSLYTQPLSAFVGRHECDFHKYADDTQLMKDSRIRDLSNMLKNMELCITSVKATL